MISTNQLEVYVNGRIGTYFDSFGVEHIPKEIKRYIGNKYITTNICRIQAYNSIICRTFCIGSIAFTLEDKSF